MADDILEFHAARLLLPVSPDVTWPAALHVNHGHDCFRRFTVAYGLAVNPAEFVDHRPHTTITPLPPPAPPAKYGNEYIDN